MDPNSLLLVPERWRVPAKIFTLAVTLAMLAFFIAGVPVRVQALSQPCPDPNDCPPLFLTPAELPALDALGWTVQGYALYQTAMEVVLVAVFMALVAVIFSRLSNTVIGLVTCLGLVQLAFATANVAFTLTEFYPGLRLPFYLLVGFTNSALLLLIVLFPDGRFHPRWLRYPFLLVVLANFLLQLELSRNNSGLMLNTSQFENFSALLLLAGLLMALAGQVWRFRRFAPPIQRQQVKWLILAGFALLVSSILWVVLFELRLFTPGLPVLLVNVIGMPLLFLLMFTMPLAITLGILRYRLWDIDLIIRRTASYTLVTGVLSLGFFGSVALLQNLFVQLTGQESPLAVVLSTLAIAALFNPLRLRFQAAIDRRFYRGRLEARLALEQFGDQVRSQVSLDSLSEGMLEAVQGALEPESMSLWIREQGD